MPKKGAGRPEIELDLAQIERLAQIHCTDEEIAAVVGCSVDTLARRKVNDPDFMAMLQRGKGRGRMALRRLQWQRANGGSDTMLIWLGKQLLGQRDKSDQMHMGEDGGPIVHSFRWATAPLPPEPTVIEPEPEPDAG
jgi:hypothetical protein